MSTKCLANNRGHGISNAKGQYPRIQSEVAACERNFKTYCWFKVSFANNLVCAVPMDTLKSRISPEPGGNSQAKFSRWEYPTWQTSWRMKVLCSSVLKVSERSKRKGIWLPGQSTWRWPADFQVQHNQSIVREYNSTHQVVRVSHTSLGIATVGSNNQATSRYVSKRGSQHPLHLRKLGMLNESLLRMAEPSISAHTGKTARN